MADLPLSENNYDRPSVGFAPSRLINAYIEPTPKGPRPSTRISRPGLTADYKVGSGPITALHSEPGLYGGDIFAISGNVAYRGQTPLGAVTGGAVGRIAASDTQVAFVTGGNLYVYNGTTFARVTTYDDGESALPAFSGAAFLAEQFIFPQLGSDIWWYSAVNDATSINALNFYQCEEAPDPIVDVVAIGDELAFVGAETVEWWDQTGSFNAPYQLAQGRTYTRGSAAQGTVVKHDNAMFFLGDDRVVYRSSIIPSRVSTPGIEEALRLCSNLSACTASRVLVDGHSFYVLNIPGQPSFAYDCQTQAWAEWASGAEGAGFLGLFGINSSGINYLGAVDGTIYRADPSVTADGSVQWSQIVNAGLYSLEGTFSNSSVALSFTRPVVGTPSSVQMRYSDDNGLTYSPMKTPIRLTGNTAVWRRLGYVNSPGRTYEFTIYDPYPFSVAGAVFNEARP